MTAVGVMATDDRYVMVAMLAVLALLGLVAVVRGTRRQVHETAQTVQAGAGAVNVAGQTLVSGAVIAGVQWAVVTTADPRDAVFWVVLGVPAVLAGYTLTRAVTVPPTIAHRRGGRHR